MIIDIKVKYDIISGMNFGIRMTNLYLSYAEYSLDSIYHYMLNSYYDIQIEELSSDHFTDEECICILNDIKESVKEERLFKKLQK